MLSTILIIRVILCQDDSMFAIDEYFDEVETTNSMNFSNVWKIKLMFY